MVLYGWSGMPWFAGLALGVGIALWAAAVFLLVRIAASVFSSRSRDDAETPLKVLERRYARGEISAAEFEQAKRDLT